MPALGLALVGVYGVLALGVRVGAQLRRTGSSGFNGLHGAPGSAEWSAEVLFAAALALGVAGPALQLAHVLRGVAALEGAATHVAGAALACAGIALTSVAQFQMGSAWRIGVDPGERTELVSHGLFALARNPIYTATVCAFAGVALLAPNPVTLAGAVLLVVALELHTRLVEEPHLLRTHGHAYALYARRVGRFVPGVGRLGAGGGRTEQAVAGAPSRPHARPRERGLDEAKGQGSEPS